MKEFITWWFWRRWNIYCPKYDIGHLFNYNEKFQTSLFDWDESFISPCTLNPINIGGLPPGKWTPEIMFIGFECDDP